MTFGGDLRFAETRHRPVPSCPRCRPWRDESAKNVPAVHDRPARGFLFGVGTPRALFRRTCARTALYDYYYRSTRCRNTTHALTAARRHDGRGERPFSFRPVRTRLFTYIGVEKNIKKKNKKKKTSNISLERTRASIAVAVGRTPANTTRRIRRTSDIDQNVSSSFVPSKISIITLFYRVPEQPPAGRPSARKAPRARRARPTNGGIAVIIIFIHRDRRGGRVKGLFFNSRIFVLRIVMAHSRARRRFQYAFVRITRFPEKFLRNVRLGYV